MSTMKIFMLMLFFGIVISERMKDRMYHLFPQYSYGYCFRRLNGTTQTGCSADGAVGMLVFVNFTDNLENVLQQDRGSDQIVLAMDVKTFLSNRSIADTLVKVDPSHVSGLLLLESSNVSQYVSKYSSDASCPDRTLSIYRNKACVQSAAGIMWNQAALQEVGLVMRQLPFPFVLIRKPKELTVLRDCWNKYGGNMNRRNNRVCAVRIHLRMTAVKDSVVCLRRQNLAQYQLFVPKQFCADVGDFSLASTTANIKNNENRNERSVVALITRIDSITLFQDVSPAAGSALSGLITVIAAAEALFKSENLRNGSTDVLVVLLHAESLDYLGSISAVYSMKRNGFLSEKKSISPIKFEHLKSIIEVNQVGNPEGSQFFAHVDRYSFTHSRELVNDLLNQTEGNVSVKLASNASQLPPSSIQMFLKEDISLPAVVLTDHKAVYRNKYYHSFLDTDFSLSSNLETLTDVASTVAKTVYKQATGKSPPDSLRAQKQTVADLVKCYLHDSNCPMIAALVPAKTLKIFKDIGAPLPSMPNIYSVDRYLPLTLFTQYLAGYIFGERLNVTRAECEKLGKTASKPLRYDWAPGFKVNGKQRPFCYVTKIMKTAARSPAITIKNYDWSKSSPYPTWTESYWDEPDVRVFLMASKSWERFVFLTGFFLLVISLLLGYIASRNIEQLFPSMLTIEQQPLANPQ